MEGRLGVLRDVGRLLKLKAFGPVPVKNGRSLE
jgi:hypothetical protein